MNKKFIFILSLIFILSFTMNTQVVKASDKSSHLQLKQDDKGYYISDKKGTKQIGWIKMNGNCYHTDNNGYIQKGWITLNNKSYYLDNSGVMKTGWLQIDDNKYYLNDNGVMQTGLQKIDGNMYYLDAKGILKTSLQKIGSSWYYLNDKGIMQTVNQEIDGRKLYINSDGKIQKGWVKKDNSWYYISANKLATGFKKLERNGHLDLYYFDKNNVMLSDTIFESYYIRPDGVAIEITKNDTHSQLQYNLFKYMANCNNRESVHETAIKLHDGDTSNNCVFFTSEALRRIGVPIPLSIGYTEDLKKELVERNWEACTNLNDLKPGDVVFVNNIHAFIFMNWSSDPYAYVVDNQKEEFTQVLHNRDIFNNESTHGTKKATVFYRLKSNKVPLYKYYNGLDYIYTSISDELETENNAYKPLGIECIVYKNQEPETIPLYKYYNGKDHFYTTDFSKLGQGGKNNYKLNGIECYIYQKQQPGTIPLYRYTNTKKEYKNFYTTTPNKISRNSDYKLDGITGYVFPKN